jgi:5'-3' exonuclease
MVAAFDCHRKSNWRTKFYEEHKDPEVYFNMTYKGQRKLDDALNWERIQEILEDVKVFLRDSTDVRVIHHENAEADDIIYVLSENEKNFTIISSDKDFKQLISDTVKLYDPIKRKYIEFEDGEASVFLTEHIMTGDTSDNIKPIRKGIGPKTAKKWAYDPEVFMFGDKELQKRFQFNKVLIDLSELPSWIYEEIEEQTRNKQQNWNLKNVGAFFSKYKLRKLGEQIDVLHFTKKEGLNAFF